MMIPTTLQHQSAPDNMTLGGLTEHAYLNLGINLNQGAGLEEQFDYACHQIQSLPGFSKDLPGVVEGLSLRVSGSYEGKSISILLMRSNVPMRVYSPGEWLLDVSSKNSLSEQELKDVAGKISSIIAKTYEEQKFDLHMARMAAGY